MQIGFYGGDGVDGVTHLHNMFQPWLGRVPDLAVDFVDYSSWDNFKKDALWAIPAWTGVVPQLCMTVPLTVTGTPLSGIVAGHHDHAFQVVAHELCTAGFGSAIIRLGHEANGGWYPWSNLGTDSNAWAEYIAAYRHAVHVFRQVSPTFKFDWCTAAYWQQTGDKSVLYPGDDVVDYIGMDIEPQAWGTSNPTTQQCWDALQQGWSLDWLPGFAKAHNKLISLPELGVGDASSGYGPGDDGALATQLVQWAKDNGVAYVGMWDFNAGDYNSQYSDGSRPQCMAAWKGFV